MGSSQESCATPALYCPLAWEGALRPRPCAPAWCGRPHPGLLTAGWHCSTQGCPRASSPLSRSRFSHPSFRDWGLGNLVFKGPACCTGAPLSCQLLGRVGSVGSIPGTLLSATLGIPTRLPPHPHPYPRHGHAGARGFIWLSKSWLAGGALLMDFQKRSAFAAAVYFLPLWY